MKLQPAIEQLTFFGPLCRCSADHAIFFAQSMQ